MHLSSIISYAYIYIISIIQCIYSNELTIVFLDGHSEFAVLMNRTIIEATLKFVQSAGRFKGN